MFQINNKHAIIAAAKNPLRSNKMLFSGSEQFYYENNLNCNFQLSNKNILITKEIFVEASWNTILNCSSLLLLDGLEDPRNIGSILRSAAAFNYGIIIRGGKGCPINETVIKCASGAADLIPIFVLKDMASKIKVLKNNGFLFIGMEEHHETIAPQDQRKILVLGHEGSGISHLLRQNIDCFYTIPTSGPLSTLNVSVAAALAMFSL